MGVISYTCPYTRSVLPCSYEFSDDTIQAQSREERIVQLLKRVKHIKEQYPNQFWLLFIGLLISTIGASMIWPFLMIYVSQKLERPLTAVASLMTVNSAMGLLSSFIAGPLTDKIGRKWLMAISLGLNGLTYLLYSHANTLGSFMILMALSGFVNPIYRVGADAMVADLIPPDRRIDAYAVLRMGNNVGVALGPTIGGFVAATSYSIAFYIAAFGMSIYAALVALFARETLVKTIISQQKERFGGYLTVLKDRLFLTICAGFTITTIASSMIFVLLSVYTKQNFGVPESQFGFIMATNALMVVLFQVAVTRFTKRFPAYPVMVVGALLYSLGVGSVALGKGLPAFFISMIILTLGEMSLVPTSTSLVAGLAPPHMRGRYMSIYGLAWGIAVGIGPVIGGFLNDNIAPVAIWFGGLVIGLISTGIFAVLAMRKPKAMLAQLD
jgi:MFS family permease